MTVLRLLLAVGAAAFFSAVTLFLLRWLWDYSHGPAEPSWFGDIIIWSATIFVFILLACGNYSLLNRHEGQPRDER